MWEYKDNFKKQMIAMVLMITTYFMVYFFAIDKLYAGLQFGVVLSIPLLALYNDKRGKIAKLNKFMQWFFYIYYPLHLMLIFIFDSLIF